MSEPERDLHPRTEAYAAAAAILTEVLALSHNASHSSNAPPPSEPALMFQLASRLHPPSLDAHQAPRLWHTTHLRPLLYRAIDLNYPNLVTMLLRLWCPSRHNDGGDMPDWDTLAAAAVGSRSSRALHAILSDPRFAFRYDSVLWRAWGNGDREACDMVMQVGQVRDCQLAYVIAYEEESMSVEPMVTLSAARRALARAGALGQRPLVLEGQEVGAEAVARSTPLGRCVMTLLDIPDDIFEYWVHGGFIGQLSLGRLRQSCCALAARLPPSPRVLTRSLYWRLLAHLLSAGPIAPQVVSLVANLAASSLRRKRQQRRNPLTLLQSLLTLRSAAPTTEAFDHVFSHFTPMIAMDVLLLSITDHCFSSDSTPEPVKPLTQAFKLCFAFAFDRIVEVLIPDLLHVPAFLHAIRSLDIVVPESQASAVTVRKCIMAYLIQGKHALALDLLAAHAPELARAKLDLIFTLATALRLGTCPDVVDRLLNGVWAWSPHVRMDCIEVSRVLAHAVAAGNVDAVRKVVKWFPSQFGIATEMPRENWRKCEAAAVKYADQGGMDCLQLLKDGSRDERMDNVQSQNHIP